MNKSYWRKTGWKLGRLLVASLVALPAAQAQVWEVGNRVLNPPGLQTGQQFGMAVVICDLNGDHVDDLVVGAPLWDGAQAPDAGAWSVYWGSADRTLTYVRSFSAAGIDDIQASYSLACGDFDDDGRDEMAIGQPMANALDQSDSGGVLIMGYDSGSWNNGPYLSQVLTSSSTLPEPDDHFGYRLAVGNFNGDAYRDLVVGTPHEDLSTSVDSGVVQVFYGGPAGLRTDNPQTIFSPNSSAGEKFGWALAAGDFDDDGYSDLAVGAPLRTVAAQAGAGAVEIYYGSPAGLTTPPQVLDDSDFAGNAVGPSENFGYALAAGEFNQSLGFCTLFGSSCYRDLAIGVPGQTDGSEYAGKVMVAYGSAARLSVVGGTRIRPSSVGETAEVDDFFGTTLASGSLDFNLFGYQDLAIGTPYESLLGTQDGALHLVFGDSSGVNAGAAAQFLFQSSGFLIAPFVANDAFGYRIAIGDLDHDGWGDLVVGVPFKGADNTGAVQVLYGALFADGFGTNGIANWEP